MALIIPSVVYPPLPSDPVFPPVVDTDTDLMEGYKDGAVPWAYKHLTPEDMLENVNGTNRLIDPSLGAGYQGSVVGRTCIYKNTWVSIEDYDYTTGGRWRFGASWMHEDLSVLPANGICGVGRASARDALLDWATDTADGGFRMGVDKDGNVQVLIGDWNTGFDRLTYAAGISSGEAVSAYIDVRPGTGTDLYVGGVLRDSSTLEPSIEDSMDTWSFATMTVSNTNPRAWFRGATFERLGWA